MIAVSVTYDTSKFKWIIYHGWVHVFEGTAEQVDEWLIDNKLNYTEVE
jgi:hypothetical protein